MKRIVILKTDALRLYILRRNITQQDFAAIASIGNTHLSRLLARKMQPTPAIRRRLLSAAVMDFDELFEIVDSSGENV